MTPQLEAQISLLVFAGFGLLIWFLYLVIRYKKKRAQQMNRRDHLLDQASLRIRELTFLIEELYGKADNKNKS